MKETVNKEKYESFGKNENQGIDSEKPAQAEEFVESPEESYNFFLRIFLTNYLIYIYKLFQKVRKRGRITLEDVPILSKAQHYEDQSDILFSKILKHGSSIGVFSLLKEILTCLRLRFFFICITTAAYVITIFCFSLSIELFVDEISSVNGSVLNVTIYVGCGLVFVCILFQSAAYQSEMFSVRLKYIITHVLYKALIGMSEYTARTISIGDITNIATFMNMEQKNFQVFLLLTSPIALPILCYLLVRNLGIHALIALSFLLVFLLLQHFISKYNSKNIIEKDRLADERVSIVGELLEKIKNIKINSWEGIFKNKVCTTREQECYANFKYFFFQMTLWSLSSAVTYLAAMVCFLSYLYVNERISVGKVFATLHLMEIMRNFCMFYFGMGFGVCLEMNNLLGKMAQILAKSYASNKIQSLSGYSSHLPTFIKVNNLSIKLESEGHLTDVLNNYSLEIRNPGIYALGGKVGSGKSSLFKAILGVYPHGGSVDLNGRIGYAQQEPFIMPTTLKENIVFGRPFDEELYMKVIKNCCLDIDIVYLEKGDLTILGESGSKISGGQRVRISLARTLYGQPEIFFLDEPFSALDPRVGSSIFMNLKESFFKNKIVVIATNMQAIIERCDSVISIYDGNMKDRSHKLSIPNIKSRELDLPVQEGVIKKEELGIDDEIEEKKSKDPTFADDGKVDVDWKSYSKLLSFFTKFPVLFFVVPLLYIGTEIMRFFLYRLFGKLGYVLHKDPYRDIFYTLGLLIFLRFGFSIIRNFTILKIFQKIATKINEMCIQKTLGAEPRTFELVGRGVFMNRLSADLNVIDNNLPFHVLLFFSLAFPTLNHLGTVFKKINFLKPILIIFILSLKVIYLSPFTGIAASICFLVIFIFFYFCKIPYNYIELINAEQKSPMLGYLALSHSGLTTIFLNGKQDYFMNQFAILLRNSARANYTRMILARSIGLSIDLITLLFGLSTLSVIVSTISSGADPYYGQLLVGLLLMLDAGQFSFKITLFVSGLMTSPKRLFQFEAINQEETGLREVSNDSYQDQLKSWPQAGSLEISHLRMRYSPEGPLILNDINLQVKDGEKVAIVGRTGSGKSSIINCLLRMVTCENTDNKFTIFIDKHDITTLPLSVLRQRLSVISQIPFLVGGTLRLNLDPYLNHSEEEIVKALKKVGLNSLLGKSIGEYSNYLDENISKIEDHLSPGERQLICLARALLIGNKFLILDEATSNLDNESEKQISEKIDELFPGVTIIAVAHRMRSIANFDRVVVLDKGKIVEEGNIFRMLVANIDDTKISQRGIFAEMVNKSGDKLSSEILQIARNKYFSKDQIIN